MKLKPIRLDAKAVLHSDQLLEISVPDPVAEPVDVSQVLHDAGFDDAERSFLEARILGSTVDMLAQELGNLRAVERIKKRVHRKLRQIEQKPLRRDDYVAGSSLRLVRRQKLGEGLHCYSLVTLSDEFRDVMTKEWTRNIFRKNVSNVSQKPKFEAE